MCTKLVWICRRLKKIALFDGANEKWLSLRAVPFLEPPSSNWTWFAEISHERGPYYSIQVVNNYGLNNDYNSFSRGLACDQRLEELAPLNCASAATMLALGANEIVMGPLSYLTAVDTSMTHNLSPLDVNKDNVSVGQNELDRVLKLWNKEVGTEGIKQNPYKSLYKYIHPMVFGAVDRASSLSIKLTNEILSYHTRDKEKIAEISNHLNSDYPSHSYPITYLEAKGIGLNVVLIDEKLNNDLLKLNNLYSEMAQLCYTDYNEYKYHNNKIYTIMEALGKQIYYQTDKDFVWRKEDQSWITTDDNSCWRIRQSNKIENFHIR